MALLGTRMRSWIFWGTGRPRVRSLKACIWARREWICSSLNETGVCDWGGNGGNGAGWSERDGRAGVDKPFRSGRDDDEMAVYSWVILLFCRLRPACNEM